MRRGVSWSFKNKNKKEEQSKLKLSFWPSIFVPDSNLNGWLNKLTTMQPELLGLIYDIITEIKDLHLWKKKKRKALIEIFFFKRLPKVKPFSFRIRLTNNE